jgi:hypothetical protein
VDVAHGPSARLITDDVARYARYNVGEVTVRLPTWAPLAALAIAAPAMAGLLPGPSTGVAWAWSGERRYYLENEVVTPILQTFYSERNYDVRVIAWQTRLVLRCGSTHATSSRFDLDCHVDDASLSAAALPADAALKVSGDESKTQLGVIADEMDGKLSGATVQLRMKKTGRIIDVDLEGVSKSLERMALIQELLRQVVTRAVAGFDVGLPRSGNASAGAWPQYGSLLLMLPSRRGSGGGSEILHKVSAVDGPVVSFETRGKGVVAPEGDANLFDTRIEAFTRFDTADGSLVDTEWTALGKATAGSALSDGFAHSPPYGQRGWLKRLAPGETAPAMPPSREISAPGADISTLQLWSPLSGAPGAP